MLKLNMNGKALSENDITVLISKDCVQNVTEIRFFTDDGEVILDNLTSDIDININITCDENTRQKLDENKAKSTIDKLKHSLHCAYQLVESMG